MNIRHIGLTVSDISLSLSFYRDLLGFVVEKDLNEKGEYIDNFSGIKGIDVRTVKMRLNSDMMIELLQYYSHPSDKNANSIISIGCSHFAITVDKLNQVYNKLVKAGVEFNSEPQLSPDGYAKVAFCKDPDGILIELVEVLK